MWSRRPRPYMGCSADQKKKKKKKKKRKYVIKTMVKKV
jgi:hypothetical protein